MSRYYILYDDATETKVRGPIAVSSSLPITEDFTVTISQDTFELATDISTEDIIDIYLNGVLQRETVDYIKNVSTNEIVLSQTVVSSWVRVRIFKAS